MNIKNIITKARAIAAFMQSRLWPFIEPILDDFEAYLTAVVAEIAIGFVEEIEENPDFIRKGSLKKAYVIGKVKEHPFVSNNKIAERIINLAIELAVAKATKK